jgi:phosphotriesterase-related protein
MNRNSRRSFIKDAVKLSICTPLIPAGLKFEDKSGITSEENIMTVNGMVKASDLGFTLSHEHILVDFIGAENYDPGRWEDKKVVAVVKPYLDEIKEFGCKSFVECTPEYIGRDPVLLKKLSDITGMLFLTNTGFYGAADNKYMPKKAYEMDSESLAELWINESESGINGSGIKPGFMKIGVAPEPLSELHQKIVSAAGQTHLETGLSIASHTGPAIPAFEEIALLQSLGIAPEAFIWVHAQNEKDSNQRLRAAKMGAWVSIDGLNVENADQYVSWLQDFKKNDLLNKVLVSHDAGWYSPGEDGGGSFTPYTAVFKELIPKLKANGFMSTDIQQVFVKNPGKAFAKKVRKV